MNAIINLMPEQALQRALIYADIKNDEPFCLSRTYADELYHFVVRTFYMRYEFYVDAVSGEVLGISTEPLSYAAALDVRMGGEILLPAV